MASEVTVPVTFTSTPDATGKKKQLIIQITEVDIDLLQTKAQAQAGRLANLDGRTWTWALPIVLV